MEIGPIFRALFHQKSRFWLIALEIALTLAIVANCINMIVDQRQSLVRPTGLDEEHLLVVRSEPFAPDFQDEDYVEASYEEDLRTIRSLPGVVAATGMSAIPLSGGGSATGRRASNAEVDTMTAPYYIVGTDALESLGVELIEGRAFNEDDFADKQEDEDGDDSGAPSVEAPNLNNVILTRKFAEDLFPDGGALGATIQNTDGTAIDTVVGIVERMHCSWPQSSVAERVMLYPGNPASERRVRYMVRVEQGMVDSLYSSLETELVEVNDGRIVSVTTLKEIKADSFRDVTAMTQLLTGISVLLIVVTSMGIIGLTSFSVTQRRRQIGTRRALGATRVAILRYFLVENWLITGVGLGMGLVLTYGLNYALSEFADVARIGLPLVGGGMLGMWVIGLLAALIPAIRSTTVPPVIATRSV